MAIFNEDGPMELYDAEAERNSAYCDRCGGHHGGACPREPDEEDVTPCDECGADIPDSEPSMVSKSHKKSCSLHPRSEATC